MGDDDMEQEQNTVPGLMLEAIRKREYPDLPRAEGIEKVAQRYPNMWDAHRRQVQKGQVAAVSVPVQKAEPLSERDQVFAAIMKRATDLAATKNITKERALVDLTEADPSLYQAYLDAKP
jgi:hypothetical protein